MLDENEIRKSIAILMGDDTLFECRIVTEGSKRQRSGYFKSVDTLINCLKKQNLRDSNVYIVLNRMKPECYGRKQADAFCAVDTTTSDTDILNREWILIDLDPDRPSKTSATNEEVEKSQETMKRVYAYLKNQGFPEPIIAFSGNGFHLLYKVSLANSKENADLIKGFLSALDVFFSDDCVKIDTTVYNAGRICKLYGTLAQKGRNSEEQPHRMSKILYIPPQITPVPKVYIKKISETVQVERPVSSGYNNYSADSFNLEDWLNKYGLHYRPTSYGGGTKYILDHCPFDNSHTGKDAVIFKMSNGAIGFKCLHNSCADKKWKDVRLLYEPDAYSRQNEYRERRMYGHFNRSKKPEPKPLEPTQDNPIWYTPMGIFNMPKEEVHYIRTGYGGIDRKLYGLKKKGISVLTGLRSAGKSTWLDGLILNAVQSGNTVGCYSGELDEKSFMRWMIRQAAGRNGVEPGKYEGQWNVPLKNIEKISRWLEGKFFLYNNNHGNNYSQIHREIEKKIESDKLDLVVLDNLMALDIGDFGYQVLDAQKNFVLELKQLAVKEDVHILFVAHPRKTVSFLRLEDISGSGDLANAVDNAFLIHRNNEDFKIRSREMFKWKDDHVAYSGTNVIEVAKDRESGTQDWFIPLWYEPETKRLKNDIAENIVYGWQGDSMSEEEDYGFTDFEGDINEMFD